MGNRFHKLSLETGKHQSFLLPRKIGSFGLLSLPPSTKTTTDNSDNNNDNDNNDKYKGSYLFAWEDGFQIVNPTCPDKPLTPMSEGEVVNPQGLPTRLNDGRCDPMGKRYICGGYNSHVDNCRMKVFACHWKDDDKTATTTTTQQRILAHEPILTDVRCTNSLCFSPDGQTMYFADSPTQTIVAFNYYNPPQAKSNDILSSQPPRPIYNMKDDLGGNDGDAVPDGSCVDSEGYIWNAVWWHGIQSSRVQRINPKTGKVVFYVQMPDNTSRVSCCCFGGPNLDILFITTAKGSQKDGSDEEPNAGGIYAIKLAGVKGKLEHRFQV